MVYSILVTHTETTKTFVFILICSCFCYYTAIYIANHKYVVAARELFTKI